MHHNWYKIAKIQQEAGLQNYIPASLLSAIVAVMSGSAIWNAAQRFNVDPSEIETALNNPQIVQSLQIDQKEKEDPNEKTNNTINQASLTDEFLNSLKRLEGTLEYQKAKDIFRNGKFYPYIDSNGYSTVGYGHKILQGEDFTNGISPEKADQLLKQDAQKAINQTNNLISTTPMTQESAQIIANMVFQMGKDGVSNFTNMWKALKNQDYQTAAKEMLNSKWAKTDSPNRAKELANLMSKQKK